MKPWDIFLWNFPGIGPHPAVIISHSERVAHKPEVNVLLCSSHRTNRPPRQKEVLLNGADGLDWETSVKCDLAYTVPKNQLTQKRGEVSTMRENERGEPLGTLFPNSKITERR